MNWNAKELAEKLGISYSYFASLRSGSAAIEEISYDLAVRISGVLGLPTVVTQLAVGQLQPEDFYQKPENIGNFLDAALGFMQRDKEWVGFLPNTIYECANEVKYALVRSYEKASGRVLIPTRVSLESIRRNFIELIQNKSESESA